MEGAGFVELPGPANPLTIENLCRVLHSATAPHRSERQSAGEQLKVWEDAQGFLSSLQSVFLEKSLPLELRLQAIIQFKNKIDGKWRLASRARNSLSPPEKELIRSRLYDGTIHEEAKQLALYNALAIAKIVRIDYPTAWPDALTNLVTLLRTYRGGNRRHLQGTLQILLRVTKEMMTVRLRKGMSHFQAMAPELTQLLVDIYKENASMWMEFFTSGTAGDKEGADLVMMNSLTALKTIRLLIATGFEQPRHNETVRGFWTLVQVHFGKLLNLVSHDSEVPVIGKHLLEYSKFHFDICYTHPASFASLPDSLPLVRAHWDLVSKFSEVYDSSEGIRVLSSKGDSEAKSKVEGPLLERLALRGLLLIRACIKIAFRPVEAFKYRSPEAKEEQNRATEFIKNDLFKPDLVIQMTDVIISRLFVFRKSDLDVWEESPEEWENQEQSESDAFEREVRPCAEKLFLDLLHNFRELLVPPLLSYFGSAMNAQSDVATKEAVYTAMGLAAPIVRGDFDFDSLLTSTLVHDAQQQGPLCKVLRRRIAILASDWVAVKISNDNRRLIYELFRHFMNPNDEANDVVVRFTAARQLKWIVDDLGFQPEAFLPFVMDILRWMVELLQSSEIDETKLAILESMRLLVMRMENDVSQFGDYIMTALPQVWTQIDPGEFMLKQAIVAIFTALVVSMGEEAQRYHHLVIPLVKEAATPGTPLHSNLVEEVLEMWTNVLMFSRPPLSPDLIGVAGLALQNLESTSSTASFALGVVESYILLAPSSVLDDELRGPTITALAATVLRSKGRDLVSTGTGCLEYLIRLARELGGSDGVSVVLGDMMVGTHFLPDIMQKLHDAWQAHQTTGPNRKVSSLNIMTQGDYFAILARICLADPSLFANMLGSMGSLEQVWDWLSQEWFLYVNDCDVIERRKLYLLALTRLLELPAPMQDLVLSRLQDYFAMWTSVIFELQDGVADAKDGLTWGPNEPADDAEEGNYGFRTPRAEVEKELTRADPIYTVSALEFVRKRLADVIQRVGGDERFQSEWVVNVEKTVAEAFWGIARS